MNKKIHAFAAIAVIATFMLSLVAVLPAVTASESDTGSETASEPVTIPLAEISYEDLGITEAELEAAFDSLEGNGIYVTTDDDGEVAAEVIDTVDAGRFGLDKISNTHYRLYLDSLSASLCINGGATVIGAAIGSLFAPPFGTVIGAAVGIILSSAITEWGVDISNGIIVDIHLQGAVIVFGVMIYPGNPTVTSIRPQ